MGSRSFGPCWISTALNVCRMDQHTHRRRLLAAPATLALAAAGSSAVDLANELDVTPAAAGQYLRGTRRSPTGLPAALRSLVGAEAADHVLSLIPVRDRGANAS